MAYQLLCRHLCCLKTLEFVVKCTRWSYVKGISSMVVVGSIRSSGEVYESSMTKLGSHTLTTA